MTAIKGTLQELAVAMAKKQAHQVNDLLEETTILGTWKFEPTSHGLWHAYEQATEIEGAGFVKIDGVLPDVKVDSELRKIDLNIMGGKMFIGEDKATQYGGAAKYFADKTPSLLRDAGMQAEKSLIYDNILPFAKDCGNLVSAGGSAATGATGLYSMYAVRQVSSEVCGLYSEKSFQKGAMLDVEAINKGALYEKDGVLGYGIRLKGYFGFMLANKNAVAGIVNINAAHLPTAKQIDSMLVAARAQPANTKIYCHPVLWSLIAGTYKEQTLRTAVTDKDMNRLVSHWNGIEVITSYNMNNGNETAVSLS